MNVNGRSWRISLGLSLLAVCLVLSACGSPSSSSAEPIAANASPSAAVPSPAVSTAGTPIKIGYILDLTGSTAALGMDNRDAFNLYLSTVHNRIAGRPIQVLVADAAGKADVALTKAKELVENEKVSLLMGLELTPGCYAVTAYAKEMRVPEIVSESCGIQDLTLDQKYASPYLTRLTFTTSEQSDPAADWAYKKGYRKVSLVTLDYAAGLVVGDFFATAFVRRGGSIVQEIHPTIGSVDYGPYVAQLDPSADAIVAFLVGTDGLRFMDTYANYTKQMKPIIDNAGTISIGSNLAQLKEKAIGLVSSGAYTEDLQTPVNQAFLKAWTAKYPDRPVSTNAAQGWSAAQILEAALKKVDGRIEQQQAFLDALHATNMDTAKGPQKLDQYHDIIQNIYINEIVKQGTGVGQKLIATYSNMAQLSERSADELLHFPFGKMKGKWIGMTKEKLAEVKA